MAARADAAGACDGVKNGAYGFHTIAEPRPWWQVDLLDEVEVYGPDSDTDNLALHRPACQSSVSTWSTAKPLPKPKEPRYPVAETLARGRRLGTELNRLGVATAAAGREFDALEARWRSLPDPPPADQALADKLAALHEPRCGSCHTARDVARLDWIHLSAPEASLFLRAPLSRAAGGHGTCPESVYASTADAGYQSVLTLVTEAVQRAWAQPRRDLVTPTSPALPDMVFPGTLPP